MLTFEGQVYPHVQAGWPVKDFLLEVAESPAAALDTLEDWHKWLIRAKKLESAIESASTLAQLKQKLREMKYLDASQETIDETVAYLDPDGEQ